MNSSLDNIKNELAALPIEDRAEFLRISLLSLRLEVREEWLDVAQKRMEQAKAGLTEGIPAERVLKEMLGEQS